MYGNALYLRSLTDQYVMATDNNTLTLQTNRDDSHNVFIVEGDTVQTSSVVSYGDGIYLENTHSNSSGVYVNIDADGTLGVLPKTGSSRLQVQNKFGQGLAVNWARRAVNWARRGRVSQSSTSQNLAALFAVDGKIKSRIARELRYGSLGPVFSSFADELQQAATEQRKGN